MMKFVVLVLTYGRFVNCNSSILTTAYLVSISSYLHVFSFYQVKSGTIFDNVLITDDEAEAEKHGRETWGAIKVYNLNIHFTNLNVGSSAM